MLRTAVTIGWVEPTIAGVLVNDICPVVIDRTGADIHAEAARIRARGPVVRVELPGGVHAWSVTTADVARQVLTDSRFSKDPRRHWPPYANGEIGADFPLISWVLMENVTTAYGSAHSRLRKLIAKAFTAHRVKAMQPVIDAIVAGLLRNLAATDPAAAVDLKSEFAHPMAHQVIFDLIGVTGAARESMLAGARATVDTTLPPDLVEAHVQQVRREMSALVEAKRLTPDDDLASDLIAAQADDGSRLTDLELVSTLLFLLGAGTEPVTNLVTNAALALLLDDDQRDLVIAGRLSWRDVVSETLRADTPVAHLPFRFAICDIEIGGVTIAAGEPVLLNFAAAGRDEAVYGADAARFDATRDLKDHLSFGYGAHRCIGAPLALAEAESALRALFERFPGMHLAVPAADLRPQGGFIMNGRRTLPVRLAAEHAANGEMRGL